MTIISVIDLWRRW